MQLILHCYYYINPSTHNYAMITAHKVSAARESIGITEKWQQYFDICDYRCTCCFRWNLSIYCYLYLTNL